MTKVIDLLPVAHSKQWSAAGFLDIYMSCTRYCACTHDGYKVINTLLVVVLSYELNRYFIWVGGNGDQLVHGKRAGRRDPQPALFLQKLGMEFVPNIVFDPPVATTS